MSRKRTTKKWRARLKKILLISVSLLVVFFVTLIITALIVPLPQRLEEKSSQVIEFADGTPAFVFISPDEKWRISVDLAQVDPAYIKALLRLEDKRFYGHLGVDPVAILRALVVNLKRGRVVSGASTITMQLARMLEPRPRTLRSKAIEAFRAFQLELHMSKQEILEAYLCCLPFGSNLEGIQAASLAYFGPSAGSLSAAEISTLLAVPQNGIILWAQANGDEDCNGVFDTVGTCPCGFEEHVYAAGPGRRARDVQCRILSGQPIPQGVCVRPS